MSQHDSDRREAMCFLHDAAVDWARDNYSAISRPAREVACVSPEASPGAGRLTRAAASST